jgi:hypothetical protein
MRFRADRTGSIGPVVGPMRTKRTSVTPMKRNASRRYGVAMSMRPRFMPVTKSLPLATITTVGLSLSSGR